MESLRAERDLYRGLLELHQRTELGPFLTEALSLCAGLAGARQGLLEVRADPDDPGGRRWTIAHGSTEAEVEGFRRTLSSGIIAAAIGRGETISTAAASSDPRFAHNPSVAAHRIQAVLCAPIGEPAFGVLYLQGRDGPGPFDEDARRRAELLARQLAPLAHRLLLEESRRAGDDPTAAWRAQLALDGVIGRSAGLAEALRMVAIAAPARVSVLLTGASGTGKTQLARAVHANSPRARGPFVELNCAAIPEALIESELFGAMPGAFTGATRRLRGKVELAAGGTLFLDEIGELAPPLQGKLLTLLQSASYWPVGADKPQAADARVVAATNRDLERAIADGRFREDLYHRLAVVRIEMPPLSARPEDLVLLAEHFRTASAQANAVGAPPFSPAAVVALRRHGWTGNVRELANKVEWAVLQAAAEKAVRIEPSHLFDRAAADPDWRSWPDDWREATAAFQRQLLRHALEAEGWNRAAAARRLRISRPYLYQVMEALGVEAPAER